MLYAQLAFRSSMTDRIPATCIAVNVHISAADEVCAVAGLSASERRRAYTIVKAVASCAAVFESVSRSITLLPSRKPKPWPLLSFSMDAGRFASLEADSDQSGSSEAN